MEIPLLPTTTKEKEENDLLSPPYLKLRSLIALFFSYYFISCIAPVLTISQLKNNPDNPLQAHLTGWLGGSCYGICFILITASDDNKVICGWVGFIGLIICIIWTLYFLTPGV
jgi:hypothetical protein